MYYSDRPHIPFSLTELSGGHSGAELYRVETVDQKFLLKILPGSFDQRKLDRIGEICKLYQSAGIRSLDLIKFGKVKAENRPYCFYNHIDGDNYEIVGNQSSETANYEVGKQIGLWLGVLKNTTPSARLADHKEDINKMTEKVAAEYWRLLSNPAAMRVALEYYDMSTLVRAGEELLVVKEIFKDSTPHLIHGDIKRSNVILDGDGRLWLIDIESMKMSYDILNFRYQMSWFLSGKNNKSMQFLKGVFDGLYKCTRPINFQQQLKYVTLLNFCEHTARHAQEEERIRDYYTRMQPVFPKLWTGEVEV